MSLRFLCLTIYFKENWFRTVVSDPLLDIIAKLAISSFLSKVSRNGSDDFP